VVNDFVEVVILVVFVSPVLVVSDGSFVGGLNEFHPRSKSFMMKSTTFELRKYLKKSTNKIKMRKSHRNPSHTMTHNGFRSTDIGTPIM